MHLLNTALTAGLSNSLTYNEYAVDVQGWQRKCIRPVLVKNVPNISQGSVATYIRRDEFISDDSEGERILKTASL